MPVTMGGIATGMNTDDIIKKLVNVESQSIVKIQQEKSSNNQRKKALQSYGVQLADLQKTVKELYGFRASYDDKKGISSNLGVLEAVASKSAQKGTNKVKVLQTASNHKISTDPVELSLDLPAGQFEIEVGKDNRPVKFRGGNVIKLKEKIEEAAGSMVSVSSVNTDGLRHVISIESKTQGKNGEIKIRGDSEFLKKLGLVKGEKDEEKEKVSLVFDSKYFSSYSGEQKTEQQDGSLTVAPDGRSVSMKGVLWREYTLPIETEIKKNSVLQFGLEYIPVKNEEGDDALPYKIEAGPDEITVIKGIELHGYNISRERPVEAKKKKPFADDIIGAGVVSVENGVRKEKIYKIQKDAKGIQEFPVGADFEGKKISKVVFYCNDGEAKFTDGAIAAPLDRKGLLEPKNLIADAKDAKMNVDGVEITRSKNDGISDVIKGVTLNLKGANDKEDVTITVDNDINGAIKKINIFIDAYNKYIDVTEDLTKAAKMHKPGDFGKMKGDTGLFMGDMAIIRLSNQLKTLVGGSFPSKVEKPVRTLPQIGITTGKINAQWETIKEGKLKLEETLLRDAIISNPDGVKELFGSDNDGDNRIDNGFAYSFENAIDPYVKPGKNIIATKIDLQDEQNKRADERIVRQTDHVKSYEDKLRKKFATMEKAVSSSKSQQNWMKQQMNNNNNNNNNGQ
jgi:flagellar hook-associated protein 2